MSFRFTLRDLFFCITIGSFLFAGLLAVLYSIYAARDAGRHMRDLSHTFGTGFALQLYYEKHGRYPPAVLRDGSGVPVMSWRVAATPFIEQPQVLAAYRQDQPWNSPANNAACDVDRLIYCFDDSLRFTNVVMPTSPGMIGEKSVTLDDITDRRDETILVIGLKESDILWHEPRDLAISEITRAPDNPQRILIRGKLFQGAWCVMVNSERIWLPADLDYDTFVAMLTISGGEKVDMSWRTER